MAQLAPRPARRYARAATSTDSGAQWRRHIALRLAAHSPTERAALQTADIARRLMLGSVLHH
jgi:hypothetical protein